MNSDRFAIIGHYYSPIPFYAGKVLKYEGLATEGNREHCMSNPGWRMLPDYIADRISADTLQPFTDY